MGLGEKIFRGIAWSAISRIAIQTVQFVIGIVLARILTPEEYGILGILYVFIVISRVFIDSGFTKALIQKQDRSEKDISTVFLFNIGISILSYLILWLSGPIIEDFYNIDQLALLLRVIAITLVINAIYTVPVTLITIKLDFKTLGKVNVSAAIISGCIWA
jgi:O-antigen/teichoic acid export membrane protein